MKLVMFVLLSALWLGACGNSKMRQMSNSDLAAKRSTCLNRNPTAPGQVTACENIRKECERRRKEGNFAC